MRLGKDDFDKPSQQRARGSHCTNAARFSRGLPASTRKESKRRYASKRPPEESSDDYLSSDIGHYNVPAESRRLRRVGFGILIGGTVVAIGIAVLDAFHKMTTAFTSLSSFFERAAWGQFLTGLGAFTKVGLLLLAVVLLWQFLRRRRRAAK